MTCAHTFFRLYALVICDHAPAQRNVEDFDFVSAVPNSNCHTVGTMLGHFGHGPYDLDISATENAEGEHFGHNYKIGFGVCACIKCVMHFLIFWNQICM